MPTRSAHARWEGTLQDGKGQLDLGSGAFRGSYSFASRFENGAGTNPEELLGAAHAGCFSMALAHALGQAGFKPDFVDTNARVTIEREGKEFSIRRVHLVCEASVPRLAEADFLRHAAAAKQGCPVSRALAGTEITLEARLAS